MPWYYSAYAYDGGSSAEAWGRRSDRGASPCFSTKYACYKYASSLLVHGIARRGGLGGQQRAVDGRGAHVGALVDRLEVREQLRPVRLTMPRGRPPDSASGGARRVTGGCAGGRGAAASWVWVRASRNDSSPVESCSPSLDSAVSISVTYRAHGLSRPPRCHGCATWRALASSATASFACLPSLTSRSISARRRRSAAGCF